MHFIHVPNWLGGQDKSDSPYSDPFFVDIIKPELEDELFCNLERQSEQCTASEIQEWHEKYLRRNQRDNSSRS